LSIYGSPQLSPNNSQINYDSDHDFTWTYSGTAAQTHYRIYIYKNSDNSLTYDSTKIASATPTHTVPSGTLTNNTLYKWNVITYSGTDSATSSWSLFTCASNPTFTLGATPTSVQTFPFSVLYNQAEGIPIKWYRFYLYQSATPSVVINDSDILYPDSLVAYSATPLTHVFDGLISGNSYKVRAIGENQLGYSLDTGLSSAFSITYSYPPDIPTLVTSIDNDSGAITLNWATLKQILGFYSGTPTYVTGKFGYGLQIDANATLHYNTESIPNDYTAYCWIKLNTAYNGVFIKFGEDNTGMQVFFNGTSFGFKHGDYITCGRNATSLIGTWVLVGAKYGKILIKGSGYEEVLGG
jgi:hypothetical protein